MIKTSVTAIILFTLSILSIIYGFLMAKWLYGLGGDTYWGLFNEPLIFMPVVFGLFCGLLGFITYRIGKLIN